MLLGLLISSGAHLWLDVKETLEFEFVLEIICKALSMIFPSIPSQNVLETELIN